MVRNVDANSWFGIDMTDMEQKALEVIWDFGGEASINTVARQLQVSLEYTRLICERLGEQEYIDVTRRGWCTLKGKGKLAAARRKVSKPKKIVVPSVSLHGGLRSQKKRKLVLRY